MPSPWWLGNRVSRGLPRLAIIVLLPLWMVPARATVADPSAPAPPAIQHVLLLSSWAEHLPWSRGLFLGVEQALASHAGANANLYVEYLDRSRLGQGLDNAELARLLGRKYRHVKLDGIIVDATPAIELVLEHGVDSFGDIPFVLLPGSRMDASALPRHAIIEIGPTVEETLLLALAQNPAAGQVLLIGDHSPEPQALLREARRVLASMAPDIQVRVSTDFTVAELQGRVAGLPRDALILFTLVFQDRAGRHWRPVDVVARLAERASVPIYVFYGSMIGVGVVGGHVQHAGRVGKAAVGAVADLVTGRRRSPGHHPAQSVSSTILDWRALRRFDITTGIPADAEIRHRKPLIWETHFRETLFAGILILSQTLLIVIIAVLALQRRHISSLRERQTALSLARQEAERANRHKSEFLARISHELRAPLGIILGYADLLHRSPGQSEPSRQQCGLIRASALHLRQLIDDLLDVAAIETDRLRPVMADTDLHRLLQEVATMMAASAAEQGLDFRSRLDPALPMRVITDGRRLRQVLLNLLGNAVKYTEHGGITLRVRAVGSEAQPAVRFLVADTGVGIASRDRERLFEAFQRLRSGQSGSGLGLAISRELVRLLGGRLHLHSRPGAGSCFGFRLPVTVLPATAPDPAPPVVGYAGPRRRLLIVDDEAAQRSLLRDLLVPLGFEIQLAGDRAGALVWLASAPPSLVLMDLALGGDSGHDLTRLLRQRLAPTPLPVVAISALPPAQAHAEETGFDAYLLKPVTVDGLIDAIGQSLGLTWLHAAPSIPFLGTPPRLELDTVMELVRWGEWQQVEEWCEDLLAGRPDLGDFVDRLRVEIASRQPQGLLAWLASIRAASH